MLDMLAVNTPPPPGSPPGTASTQGEPPTLTVVGVVNNYRPSVTTDAMIPFLIYPFSLRQPTPINYFMVRVRDGQKPNLQQDLAKFVKAFDNNAQIAAVQDMASNFDQQFQLPRFNFVLFCTLAGIALSLAIAGIILPRGINMRDCRSGIVRISYASPPWSLLSTAPQISRGAGARPVEPRSQAVRSACSRAAKCRRT